MTQPQPRQPPRNIHDTANHAGAFNGETFDSAGMERLAKALEKRPEDRDFHHITVPPRAVPFIEAMQHKQPTCRECGRPLTVCAACASGQVEHGDA